MTTYARQYSLFRSIKYSFTYLMAGHNLLYIGLVNIIIMWYPNVSIANLFLWHTFIRLNKMSSKAGSPLRDFYRIVPFVLRALGWNELKIY